MDYIFYIIIAWFLYYYLDYKLIKYTKSSIIHRAYQGWIGNEVFEKEGEYKYILNILVINKELKTYQINKEWIENNEYPFLIQVWLKYLTHDFQYYKNTTEIDKKFVGAGFPSSWWKSSAESSQYLYKKSLYTHRRNWDGDIDISITLTTVYCDLYTKKFSGTFENAKRSFEQGLSMIEKIKLKKILLNVGG